MRKRRQKKPKEKLVTANSPIGVSDSICQEISWNLISAIQKDEEKILPPAPKTVFKKDPFFDFNKPLLFEPNFLIKPEELYLRNNVEGRVVINYETIKGTEELFFLAADKAEAKVINGLNRDQESLAIKRARREKLEKDKTVNDGDMPDNYEKIYGWFRPRKSPVIKERISIRKIKKFLPNLEGNFDYLDAVFIDGVERPELADGVNEVAKILEQGNVVESNCLKQLSLGDWLKERFRG